MYLGLSIRTSKLPSLPSIWIKKMSIHLRLKANVDSEFKAGLDEKKTKVKFSRYLFGLRLQHNYNSMAWFNFLFPSSTFLHC